VDRGQLETWIATYERAWRTPGTETLAELFAPDASYSTGPYEEPHRGLEAIAAMWERERETPDENFEMRSEVVAVDGDTGVARVGVRYGAPRAQEYRDLWIIRLGDGGRCVEFEEWPFSPPGTNGTIAAGA
jgi:uncharacterized protein (TIGR02246 family)